MTPVGEILLSLMDEVGADRGLPETLCRSARRRLHVAGVSIAIMSDGGAVEMSAASDNDRAQHLSQLQLSLGDGPALEAFSSGRLVHESDLAGSGFARWPMWARGALAADVRSVFSFPLRIGGIRLGVVTLYDSEAGTLDNGRLTTALHYVDAAVVIVLYLQSDPTGDRLAPGAGVDEDLDDAFWFDAEVHQATGMVSVRMSVPLPDALLLLRGRAYADGRPITALAHDVVTRVVQFD